MKRVFCSRAIVWCISLISPVVLVPVYLSSLHPAHSNSIVLADGVPMPPPEPLPPPPPPTVSNALIDGVPMPPPEPLPPPPPPGIADTSYQA